MLEADPRRSVYVGANEQKKEAAARTFCPRSAVGVYLERIGQLSFFLSLPVCVLIGSQESNRPHTRRVESESTYKMVNYLL